MASKKDSEDDVPEGEDGEVAAEGGGKKKPPMMIIIIAAVVLVLVLGGGGAAFFLLKPKPEVSAEKDKKGEHGKKKDEKKEEKKGEGKEEKALVTIKEGPEGVMFATLPNVVVNMQAADGRPTYLKLKLTLEVPDEETAEALEPAMPRLQDMFQSFLRELRPEDLQGSQGSYQLRTEILRRVNLVIAPAKVNAVLIEEMLIN
ncbi:MAG: flagellar basal body-associated FliL family protein [Alphaproteobacteria bacterium]